MYMKPHQFAEAMKPARHARLFELIRQSQDMLKPTPAAKTTDTDMLAFRDLAIASWGR
jgi:hypothetical protein